MTTLVTARGRKAWPLSGLVFPTAAGYPIPMQRGIDLLDVDAAQSYSQIYRTQLWVYVVVNKLVKGISRLPLKVYEKADRPTPPDADPADTPAPAPAAFSDRNRVEQGWLYDLLRNPWPRASTFDLVSHWVGQTAIYGQSVTWLYRPGPGRPPTEAWPLNFRYVSVIQGSDRPIAGYRYMGPAGYRTFLPEDIVHLRWWSPDGDGVSPLEPLRRTLQMEDAAQRYGISSFRNALRPSGAVKVEKPIRSKADEQKLRAELEAMHGGPDRAFRVALLQGDMSWQPFGHTAQEAELIPGRRLNREETCAAYDVDPTMVGILDRATFSNVTDAHRRLYMDTYGPWLAMMESGLQAQLIEPELGGSRTFAEFDLNEALRGGVEERAIAYLRWMQSGTRTPNELRALENLPAIDHPAANTVYVPVNLAPVGLPDTATKPNQLDAAIGDPAADPAGAMPQLSPDVVKAIVAVVEDRFPQLDDLDLLARTNGHR